MMTNNIKLKNAVNNTISLIGILDVKAIDSLKNDLEEMHKVLDIESTNLIIEIENSISIQSRMIDHNCLYEIENSISKIDSSVPDKTINSVKLILDNMSKKINELENEIRSKNIEKLNEIKDDKVLMSEFVNTLKANNTKALLLFDGNNLRQSLLDTFVTQDSDIMMNEKDKIISSVITYVDLATKKYSEYVDKVQDIIDVVDNIETLIKCCVVAKELTYNYSVDYLISRTTNELYTLAENKLKEVI